MELTPEVRKVLREAEVEIQLMVARFTPRQREAWDLAHRLGIIQNPLGPDDAWEQIIEYVVSRYVPPRGGRE